ncbi:MAG: type II toxin-antitoxin system HipA family toxin [Reyranellaceae bacterium]
MARPRVRSPLNVLLNGSLVGQLNRAASGAIDFRYAAQWLERDNAIPVSLSLPLREDRYIGDPVVAVFDNLLPDDAGIRRRVAERAQADGTDPYSLLAAIGRDCAGALQLVTEGTEPTPVGTIEADRMSEKDVTALLADLGRSPLGIGAERDFRISLAGMQEKTALLFWKKAWHLPHGTTPTTHILKPQIGKLVGGIDLSQSVENEHLCLRIVAELGLPVASSRIVEFGGHPVLVVERFDRLWTGKDRLLRIPQEDCCQALGVPSTRKFEAEGGPGIRAILDLLKGSDTPENDRRRFFKAQVVFWLLAATDGHAKNFSLHLAPGGRFTLAPLYDILSTQPLLDSGQLTKRQMKLSMAVGKSRHYAVDAIQPRRFLQTAAACGLPEKTVHAIFDELIGQGERAVEKARSAMPGNFPPTLAKSITGGFRQRLDLLSGSCRAQ